MILKRTCLTFSFFFFSVLLWAQEIDLKEAALMASSTIREPVRATLLKTMQEEVAQRTDIDLQAVTEPDAPSLILLAKAGDREINGLKVPVSTDQSAPEYKPEGYRIKAEKRGDQDILWFIGADERGLLFAIGDFLRNNVLTKNRISFDKKNEIATSPEYPMRGHQLGYRNTANSWDAWDVDQFETHIRELALFGTNAIENTPFHDGPESPVMPVSRKVMNVEMSRICDKYDLDYWIWTPANVDLSIPSELDSLVRQHTEYYKEIPRLDGVFFPGGDPGHNDPKYVMPFLKKLSEALHTYHPEAGMWISLQGFSDQQVDYFYAYLEKFSPDWLAGVATGPSSPGIAETRFRLPKKYKHRLYPDITHTVRCDYPVKNWDQAFALTQGREVSNPQPFYYQSIHNQYAPFSDGFISYSDGVHDDVNKVLYSQLAWDSKKEVQEILEAYSRFFFGPEVAREAADGILALEKNWEGPVEKNVGIEMTFAYWKELDDRHPELKENWRWQLLQLRSYYDTYQARRKKYEKYLEKQANAMMAQAEDMGAAAAMQEALELVNKAEKEPVYPEMRQRIVDYCEELWQSIGLQTSVEKYHAKNPERGAILDFLDYPLNNRWWLEDEFKKIAEMDTEAEKIDRLKVLASWENPGEGSYYDDISNVSQQTHVLTDSYDATDVAWWDHGYSRKRLSTQLFQGAPKLIYEDLDPNGDYIIRISGEGEALLRVNGHRIEPFAYNKGMEEFKQFRVGRKYLATGRLVITFDEPEESQINWREQSKISDIWLLKQEKSLVEEYNTSEVKQPNYGID